jgi:hypothetical protein
MTPARAHRERQLAQLAASQSASPVANRLGEAATEYASMRARLGVDIRRLSEIQSIENKVELKRELVPEYFEWCRGVLVADSGAEDDIVAHLMIWGLDIGNWDFGLDLADYLIRHKLPLPERFDRTAPTLVCEEVADAAIKSLGQGETFPLSVLGRVAYMVADADIFDQVRAKLHKALGLVQLGLADGIQPGGDGPAGQLRAMLEDARANLKRALELDSNSGVKKTLEQLGRRIDKLTEHSTSAS